MRATVMLSGLLALAVALPGCASKKKLNEPLGVVAAPAVYREGMAALQRHELKRAKTLLEQISYAPDERERLEPLVRLAIADVTFYDRYGVSLIDARSLYLDFVALYGDHPLAPYAQFQAGVCSLLQVARPSKDQTETRQAIRDLRVAERRFPNSAFAEAARTMMRQAQNNLAEHEFMVGKFYLNRKAPLAAVNRFQGILELYPHYSEKDKLYLYLGQALLKLDNDLEARIYLDKLVTDFPDGQYVDEALKELDKAGGRLEEFELTGSQ